MAYTSYKPDVPVEITGMEQFGCEAEARDGHSCSGQGARLMPGGADGVCADAVEAALQQLPAGLRGGAGVREFQAGIEARQRMLGNRAFMRRVAALQSGGWAAGSLSPCLQPAEVAPLQLMGKKKKKPGALEVGAGSGGQAAGAAGKAAPGPAAGTVPGLEPEPAGGAAAGATKKKKKSRVQAALNALRGEGVAAFAGFIEAEIGEAEILRKLVERVMRAEDLAGVRKEALAVVEGRLRLLASGGDAGVPEAAAPAPGRQAPEFAVIAPVKSELAPKELELVKACFGGDVGQVRYLLKHRKIDINVAAESGTPLCYAAYKGYAGIVRELLPVPDVDVNLAGQQGATALYLAAQEGHAEVVELLLGKSGINVNAAALTGATPLYIASEEGRVAVVELLLAMPGIDVNAGREYGTPLQVAAEKGHTEVVKLLLAAPGIDIDRQRQDGSTALFLAAQNNFPGIVEQLVRWGADANLTLSDGTPPLYLAAHRGYLEVVRGLLPAPGIRLNHGADERFIPLGIAAQQGHKDIVRLLLRHGADPNMKSGAGFTPLHVACLEGHTAIVQVLLNAGADPDAGVVDSRGQTQTPDSLAGIRGHHEVASILKAGRRRREEAPPRPDSPTCLARAKDALREEVRIRLRAGSLNPQDGPLLLQEVNAADRLDALCARYDRLAQVERHKERVEAAAPEYSLAAKTGLDAEAVEGEIKRYLDPDYHWFVKQAVNDMEFGRGRPLAGYPRLWYASGGVAGVGNCGVFYYLEESGEKIRVAGIGRYEGSGCYRLDYADRELGGGDRIVRIA